MYSLTSDCEDDDLLQTETDRDRQADYSNQAYIQTETSKQIIQTGSQAHIHS